jgi:uncharacterized protein (DUF362 family)
MVAQRTTRRDFLSRSLRGAALSGALWPGWAVRPAGASPPRSQVALTAGEDRADIIYRGLQMFRREIAGAIGSRRIIVKPNVVSIATSKALAVTHVDTLEAVLEFLKSIGKLNVTIAESSAEGLTMSGYENYGYFRLTRQYPVRLIDLNQEEFEALTIWNGAGTRSVRISNLLLDPNHFVISVPRLKTHDCVVATLALKNIVMGAPIADVPYYRGNPSGCRHDKPRMHGTGNQDLNDNLHRLAPRLAPDLAVIDGYQGMQGNGPTGGTPVEHRVAVVSLDWMAAERVALELMGINAAWPAYLNYCWQSGLGQFDLSQIEVLGESMASHQLTYQLHDNISGQLGMRSTPRT